MHFDTKKLISLIVATFFILILFQFNFNIKILPFSSILTLPKPVNNKTLKIYIQEIDPIYNKYITNNNCTSCNCLFNDQNGLDPLIHCIIEKSEFYTKNIKEATFIFVPIYTSLMYSYDEPAEIPDEVKKTPEFSIWRGSRHLISDTRYSFYDDDQYMKFRDQHIVIATNLTVEFIREDRWLHSRHIQVPPLQIKENYNFIKEKEFNVSIIAKNEDIMKINQLLDLQNDILQSHIITLNKTYEQVINEIEKSVFTIFIPNENLDATFIYEILRSYSIPIMISYPFLPAFAHTHIDYNKISMRIPINKINTLKERIQSFNINEGQNLLKKYHNYLMWPLPTSQGDLNINNIEENAGTILLDYINTRYRVLKPSLRRTYLGSDEYI